jgi:arylsulfatase
MGSQARLAARGSFVLESAVPVERLLFSIGLPSGRGPARFRVEAEVGDEWIAVHEDLVENGADEWQDRRVDLAGDARGARRFRFEAIAVTGAAKPVWGSPLLLGRRGGPPRPDLLLVLIDTLGASKLGGNRELTPRMDAFLDESFRFHRAYTQFGTTLTSLSSLLTGLYPIHHGVYGGRYRRLASAPLAAALADGGYLTLAVTEGGFANSAFGLGRSFDRYDNGGPQLGLTAGAAPRTFSTALDWIDRHADDTRFLLLVHTYEVHSPYQPRSEASIRRAGGVASDAALRDPDWQSRAILKQLLKPLGATEIRVLETLHLATVHDVDRAFGELLDGIEARARAEDTVVALLSDHGEAFGQDGAVGHGATLHDSVMHIPLGFRWPGHLARGESEGPVQLIDVLPTIIELAGLPVPEGIDGTSLAPIVRGEAEGSGRPAFSELFTQCGPWKVPDCERSGVAVQTQRFRFAVSNREPAGVLHDLAADPLQERDVSAQHPEEAERHRSLIRAYLASRREPHEITAEALDDELRERLEALGYLD